MTYDAAIARQPLNALFDLKGSSAAIQNWAADVLSTLPERPNSRSGQASVELYHVGRNHWIARAPLEQEAELEKHLSPTNCPAEISIVRVSDTLTFFRVVGPQADEVMSIACPLDIHETEFGEETVTYTELFGLKALFMRCEDGFEFAVEQSFGDMVEDYLSRAVA
ncbi:sarcosine oxidase subunit gamma (plasmid) [Ruegeria conchae]|uniref:sarcosine oxidase subunit gamma n=1 Tax=Ruegeria conchae TaxID=981384 RepID=UPI0021A931FC|nr:sarcosine oxidase subunit gamma [Ruegeria conchae]UWR05368.1 sarcosine oxidase subunit gamma [Ruegeria conchae]